MEEIHPQPQPTNYKFTMMYILSNQKTKTDQKK